MSADLTVLIDYDNVAMQFVGRADTVLALANVVESIVVSVISYLPEAQSLNLRLYGGWIDERGYFSSSAQRLLSELRHFRGKRGRSRFATSLALTLRAAPACRLVGSLRESGARPRQKMIDGMLTLDIVDSAAGGSAVAIASDDDDLVPAALVAAKTPAKVYWIRARTRDSCNDFLLGDVGVKFLPLVLGRS